MADASSKSAVIKAIVGNGIIAIAKGIAAVISGSGAMMAECIHSVVDTLNQGLLLIGHQRSLSKATPRFPFGFGPEANFWGLLAAIGVLIFGGALTIEHGIHAVMHPEMPEGVGLAIGVLIFAFLLEAWVTWSVIKGIAPSRNGKSWIAHIKAQDPGTLTVILEDSAAVMGCVLALLAIVLCQVTGNGIWDAICQLVIGSMLALVGLYLIWKNRGLLIGQAVDKQLSDRLRGFIADFQGIDQVVHMQTRQLSAHTFSVKADIAMSGGEIAGAIIPEHKQHVLDAQTEAEAAEILGRFSHQAFQYQGQLIDRLEAELREEFPGAVFINLEPHYLADDAAAE